MPDRRDSYRLPESTAFTPGTERPACSVKGVVGHHLQVGTAWSEAMSSIDGAVWRTSPPA